MSIKKRGACVHWDFLKLLRHKKSVFRTFSEQDTETNHVSCPDVRARDVTNCSLLAYFLGNNPVIDLGIVHLSLLSGRYVQGYLAHKKTPNPLGPP